MTTHIENYGGTQWKRIKTDFDLLSLQNQSDYTSSEWGTGRRARMLLCAHFFEISGHNLPLESIP